MNTSRSVIRAALAVAVVVSLAASSAVAQDMSGVGAAPAAAGGGGGLGLRDAGSGGGGDPGGGGAWGSMLDAGRSAATNVWNNSTPGQIFNGGRNLVENYADPVRRSEAWNQLGNAWDGFQKFNTVQNTFRNAFDGQNVEFFDPRPQQGGGWVLGARTTYNDQLPGQFQNMFQDLGMPRADQATGQFGQDLRFLNGQPITTYLGVGGNKPINGLRMEFGTQGGVTPGPVDSIPPGFSARFNDSVLPNMIAQGASQGPGSIQIPIRKGNFRGTMKGYPGTPQMNGNGNGFTIPTKGNVFLSNGRRLFKVTANGGSSGSMNINNLRVNPQTNMVQADLYGNLSNHNPLIKVGPNGGLRFRPDAGSNMVKNQARELIPKYTRQVFRKVNQQLSQKSDFIHLNTPRVWTDGQYTNIRSTANIDVNKAIRPFVNPGTNQLRLNKVQLRDSALEVQGTGLWPTLRGQLPQ